MKIIKFILNSVIQPFVVLLNCLKSVDAPFISEEGYLVMEDPEKMEKVREAIKNRNNKSIIVNFK